MFTVCSLLTDKNFRVYLTFDLMRNAVRFSLNSKNGKIYEIDMFNCDGDL